MSLARNFKHPLFIGIVVVAALSAVAAVYAFGRRSPPADGEEVTTQSIIRAVFADDRLWLLHYDGSLASLAPRAAKAKMIKVYGKVKEICKSNGRLIAMIEDTINSWKIQERSPGEWKSVAPIASDTDTFITLACDDFDITVITNRRIINVRGETIRAIRLSQQFQPPFDGGTATAEGSVIWLGFNVGEWGGGLRRIGRTDGKVEVIEYNRSNDLCGGPLNTGCDPVTGIVAAPGNSHCIFAAIGLVHMMSHGRIVEVCGNEIRRFYFKPLEPQPPGNRLDDGEPSSTTAFFGLARAGNRIWAIGIDGLYQFDGSALPQFQPLPKFENRGGYRVSFDIPGIALVLTNVNQRNSVSGSVPIMATR